jgi:hypothetical protein
MANERKRVLGEIITWHMGQIVERITGDHVNVVEVNPYREMNPILEEARAAIEKRQFWGRLQQGIFGKQVFDQR